MRLLNLILGLFLIGSCSAGFLLENKYHADRTAEALFCRFQLCENVELEKVADEEYAQPDAASRQQSADDFAILLNRNPHWPFRWEDLGDAYLQLDRPKEAESCYRQALALAPHWPATLIRVEVFDFQSGRIQEAFPLATEVLDKVSRFDENIFYQYIQPGSNLTQILNVGFPNNPRPAAAFLRYLISWNKVASARQVWQWMIARNLTDGRIARDYAAYLLSAGRPQEAADAWRQFLGPAARDKERSNFVFNGQFNQDFDGSPFDWQIRTTPGVSVKREQNPADGGAWSLHLEFDGKSNLENCGLIQSVVLREGTYRFRARLRSDALSTDQGVHIRLSAGRNIQWEGQPVVGKIPWTTQEFRFQVPSGGGTYSIELVRSSSLKFDNLLSGSLWLTGVSIEPMSSVPQVP